MKLSRTVVNESGEVEAAVARYMSPAPPIMRVNEDGLAPPPLDAEVCVVPSPNLIAEMEAVTVLVNWETVRLDIEVKLLSEKLNEPVTLFIVETFNPVRIDVPSIETALDVTKSVGMFLLNPIIKESVVRLFNSLLPSMPLPMTILELEALTKF